MNLCVVGRAGKTAEAAIPPKVYSAELGRRGIHVTATRRVVYRGTVLRPPTAEAYRKKG